MGYFVLNNICGVVIYNASGDIIQENFSFQSPFGIDIDEKNFKLFIAQF